MVTLKDIAARLNISPMAVSKALRDAPDISEGTKLRVRKEAEHLGYIPNEHARGLKGARTRLWGVMVQEINDPRTAGMVKGLEDVAVEEGCQILLSSSKSSEQREMAQLMRMIERKVEVIFLQPLVRMGHRHPVFELTLKYSTPVVFMEHYPADAANFQHVTWAVADSYHAGRLAAGHLHAQGHRDILYFSGPPTASSTADHLSGFKKGMEDCGIGYDEAKVFLCGLNRTAGQETTVRAMAERLGFTAVVCADDAAALGVIETLLKEGFKVPDDIVVVGYGNGLLAECAPVPLTTVSMPQVELGVAAARLGILQRAGLLSGKQKRAEPRVLPVEWLARRSTAASRPS
ncbi:MAG: LacI family DNA-binding transcriptional regulator [Candidatus Methylacidiphilales bacterium]